MDPTLGVDGCGQMGSALARLLGAAGFRLLLSSRTRHSAEVLARGIPCATAGSLESVVDGADIVILATPIQATCRDIAPRARRLIHGKPVIDVSNPGFPGRRDDVAASLAVRSDASATSAVSATTAESAAEQIAAALRNGQVVKALNCVAARWIADLQAVDATVTIPIAGDNPWAKLQVRSVLERVGFEVADAGPLSSSRWIESLTQLLLHVGTQPDTEDAVGFRLVRLVPERVADRTPIAGTS
jgi:predicted dinucleotide-binding enzyme